MRFFWASFSLTVRSPFSRIGSRSRANSWIGRPKGERRKPGSALARRVLEARVSSGPTVAAAWLSALLTLGQAQRRLRHRCPIVRSELNAAGLLNEERMHAASARWSHGGDPYDSNRITHM